MHVTIHFSTKSNNYKTINSILYYGSTLLPYDNSLNLCHLDSCKVNNQYKHFYMLPYGKSIFNFNDDSLTINRVKNSKEPHEFQNGYVIDFFNDIYISGKNKKNIETFIEHALIYYMENFHKFKKVDNKIKFYIFQNESWSVLHERSKRDFNTIYLPGNLSHDILNDMNIFLSDKIKDKYAKFGITYKKNYLFEGVPGSGKTSLSIALSSTLDKDIAILNFDHHINDNIFMKAIKSLPDNTILCLEDIDVLFIERKKSDYGKNMITFSALLNILDGYATKEGLITIITTNYLKHLDDALKRPGRIDKIIHFDYAEFDQIIKMYNIFYPDGIYLSKFLKIIKNHDITIAMLQQYFFVNNDSDIINNITDLFNMENSIKQKLSSFYS